MKTTLQQIGDRWIRTKPQPVSIDDTPLKALSVLLVIGVLALIASVCKIAEFFEDT